MKCWQKFSAKIKNLPPIFLITASGVLLVLLALLSLCFGAVFLSFEDLMGMHDIVRYIRIPRMLAAVFAGMGLAGAGVILQTLLANPLAGPNIIGVNSGAGFSTLLCCVLLPLQPSLQPLATFAGSLVAVLLIYALSQRAGTSKITLLLAGVILNSLFNSGTEILYTFFPEMVTNITSFRTGGLSYVKTDVLYPAAAIILITCIIVYIKADDLELLSLGDDIAHSLGLGVKRNRFICLFCSACLSGAVVSFAGLIGFLGLIVPHIVRIVVGSEIKLLFPLSVIWGAIFMLVCDTFARSAFSPFDIPVGIILSIIGAPFFIYILLNRKRSI